MKRITIIGTGIGVDTLTPQAREAVARAEIVLGAPRLLALWGEPTRPAYPCYLPDQVAAVVDTEEAQEFAVLVSGDVGFYSAAAGLQKALDGHDLRFIPGISSASAFFARLKRSWQDTAFLSAHGRTTNLVDTVRRHYQTFCLTGNNVNELGRKLCAAGLAHIKTFVGENLGLETEQIAEKLAADLQEGLYSPLTVLLFVNENFNNGTPCGLPDKLFARTPGIPMTKSETRAVVLSKLRLHPDCIGWDVGAGTGSVTVEMALAAYQGQIYAVERREEAFPLIRQNCQAFRLGNVTLVCAEAPDALRALPAPDAVFIGGSGGKIPEIIELVLQKNAKARIVVTAVTLETTACALDQLTKVGLETEIVQLNVARARPAGKAHLMEAQNPITILSAGGNSWNAY